MLHPYFGVVLSLALLHTGVLPGQLASPLNTQNNSIVSAVSIARPVELQSYNTSFDFYTTFTLPKIQAAAAEAKAKADAEARQAEQEAEEARHVAELLAQQQATAKASLVRLSQVDNLVPSSSGDWEGMIREKCNLLGCNSEQVIRVMYCESGGRANATNAAGYYGLFQFSMSTFNANAARIGISSPNIWDGAQQIAVATAMFAAGQAGQWSCK